MAEQIEVGDVVQLKSGGPAMTVLRLHGDHEAVDCGWFTNGPQAYEQTRFPLNSIRPYVVYVQAVGSLSPSVVRAVPC